MNDKDKNKKEEDIKEKYSYELMLITVLMNRLKKKGILTDKEITEIAHAASAASSAKMAIDFFKDTEERR